MQSNNSMAIACPDLRVRQDMGHSNSEYKQINVVDCMASIENRPCKHAGNCIIRRGFHGSKLKKGEMP